MDAAWMQQHVVDIITQSECMRHKLTGEKWRSASQSCLAVRFLWYEIEKGHNYTVCACECMRLIVLIYTCNALITTEDIGANCDIVCCALLVSAGG